ncbi:hypothetical protein A9K97_gp281 [Tokyovirus A1]|uniref:hypothetical protein n=1 Tax=Tokyovirus A1 TaxID=1826170 RepID=UPI0007A95EEC|nr:hypothetical protein A9K97_gp281 [Tokyovirus A1]BAU80070.1 hypothetical protein [Tokyovirus A1]
MERLEKFPKKWKGVVHCTKHFGHSSYHKTEDVHSCSPFVKESQWRGVVSLVSSKKEFALVIPHKLFEFSSELFVQLRKRGNWFVFSYPWLSGGCSTCDGETEASFCIKEYGGIHDLLWNHFTDREREDGLGLFLWLDEECRYPDSLQEFREKFPKKNISWIFA